jgi:hypothetical protein
MPVHEIRRTVFVNHLILTDATLRGQEQKMYEMRRIFWLKGKKVTIKWE